MSRPALMSILMFASILVLSAGTAVASPATGLWSTAEDDGQVQIYDCGARLCGRLVTSSDQTTMAMGETLNQRGVKKLFVLAPNYAAGKDMAAGAHFIFSLNHGAVTKLPRIASADHAALISAACRWIRFCDLPSSSAARLICVCRASASGSAPDFA